MYQENRRYMRTSTDAIVEMTHPGFGTITVKAKDLSDGGICVDMGNHIAPPLGTVVDVIIKRHTGALNSEPVKMEVMHTQLNGTAGLSFI